LEQDGLHQPTQSADMTPKGREAAWTSARSNSFPVMQSSDGTSRREGLLSSVRSNPLPVIPSVSGMNMTCVYDDPAAEEDTLPKTMCSGAMDIKASSWTAGSPTREN